MIRLRYPFFISLTLLISFYIFEGISQIPQTQSSAQIIKHPHLDPGYYLVLHTKASLPNSIQYQHAGQRTYIGPLPNIRSCHESRSKIKPLYPGVASELLKINTHISSN